MGTCENADIYETCWKNQQEDEQMITVILNFIR